MPDALDGCFPCCVQELHIKKIIPTVKIMKEFRGKVVGWELNILIFIDSAVK
jgi:hypothetical protein